MFYANVIVTEDNLSGCGHQSKNSRDYHKGQCALLMNNLNLPSNKFTQTCIGRQRAETISQNSPTFEDSYLVTGKGLYQSNSLQRCCLHNRCHSTPLQGDFAHINIFTDFLIFSFHISKTHLLQPVRWSSDSHAHANAPTSHRDVQLSRHFLFPPVTERPPRAL